LGRRKFRGTQADVYAALSDIQSTPSLCPVANCSVIVSAVGSRLARRSYLAWPFPRMPW
jgi:hypothetical protein